MYDVVFVNATVVDGSGASRYQADVAIDGSRIAAIGDAKTMQGRLLVDASNLVLAPGFIDFHSHAEWNLTLPDQEEFLLPFLRQGVTTFVGGNCGFSPYPVDRHTKDLVLANSQFLTNEAFEFAWETQKEFTDMVSRSGTLLNVALLTGHGSLRSLLKGNDPAPISPFEYSQMVYLIHQAKESGSYGISLGLSYIPSMFADMEELRCVFAAAAREDLIVTIHGHTYSWISPFFTDTTDSDKPAVAHNVRDIELFIKLAKEEGTKLHLSHVLLKGRKTWETLSSVLDTIDRAVGDGCDITFGVIPYHWGNTLIKTLLPNWFLEDFDRNSKDSGAVARLGRELLEMEAKIGRTSDDLILLWGGESDALAPFEGKTFRQIAQEKSIGEIETILWIIDESDGKARILTASYSGQEGVYSDPLHKLLGHPRSIIEIDAIVTDTSGPQTPAASGAFPRLLGTYCRKNHLFSLEQAVHKITGKPAERLGLVDRGRITVGAIADLVLFDPDRIAEHTSTGQPSSDGDGPTTVHVEQGTGPVGIEQVWMGGTKVVEKGKNVLKKRIGAVIIN